MAKSKKKKTSEENVEIAENELVVEVSASEIANLFQEDESRLEFQEESSPQNDSEETSEQEEPVVEMQEDNEEDEVSFLSEAAFAEDEDLIENSEDSELADSTGEMNEDLSMEPVTGALLEETELSQFESASIEEIEFVEDERLESIIESILFATDKAVSLNSLKQAFKGTQITTDKIKKCLDRLSVEYAGVRRGITLEEVTGGYQLKTKIDNVEFLRRTVKPRSFRLSGPALEVLAIVAYKQPVIKNEIDQIRGVESGHLLRALMERSLVQFEGKSELPGRPMQYGTTKKFLEIFALRNLRELPTLSQIDELLPEGITEEESNDKPILSGITETMAQTITNTYSEGEEELEKIQEQLSAVETTTQFFEEEKNRQKLKREEERAQSIREAMDLSSVTGEIVPDKDIQWLKRYEEAKLQSI